MISGLFRYIRKKHDAPAQLRMGQMYELGRGVKQNPMLAAIWFKKAAQQEYGEAQYHLAVCYEKGSGVKMDFDQAKYWFSKAAENGYEP